jgi:hypothetical protein
VTVQVVENQTPVVVSEASGTITVTYGQVSGAQPLDSDLTAIAALATTAFGRALLTLADSNALDALSLARQQANDGPGANVRADFSTLAASAGTALVFPTGYAGNDVVEPSILFDDNAPFFADANGAGGYEYVCCAGGYSGSNDLYENPNLWVSHDGTTWVYVVFSGGIGTPTAGYGGVLTPIVLANAQGDGHISDPYLCRGPDGTYYILFNQFLVATGSGGTGTGSNDWAIKGISATSLAGPWSAPVSLVQTVRANDRPSSPSAVWHRGQWQIYGVVCASTRNGIIFKYTVTGKNLLGTWVAASDVSASLPAAYSANQWWHLNVYRWGKQLFMVMQDTILNSSGSGNLWCLSSSDDGATWTVPSAPMLAGTSFYRSAAVVSERGWGIGLDLFYGQLSGNWKVSRTVASFTATAFRGDRDEKLRRALGYYSESFPLAGGSAGTALADGVVYYLPHYLFAGEVVTNIGIVITGNGSGVTLSKVGLTDSSFNLRAISADQGTSWQTAAKKTIAMITAYTVPADGLYYTVIIAKASVTLPSVARGEANGPISNLITGFPRLAATLDAQTDIPTTATPNNSASPIHAWMAVCP